MNLSPLDTIIPSFDAATLQGFDPNADLLSNQRVGGAPNRQFVQFFMRKEAGPVAVEAVINEKTGERRVTKREIREIEREWVRVITPGDTNKVEQPAEEYHRRDFVRQYAAFKSGDLTPFGTPLDECSYVQPNIVTELNYLGCKTEEQLADASDYLCNMIANGHELREIAKARCKVAQENQQLGKVNQLQIELKKSQEEMAELRKLVQQLTQSSQIVTPSGEPVSKKEPPKKQAEK